MKFFISLSLILLFGCTNLYASNLNGDANASIRHLSNTSELSNSDILHSPFNLILKKFQTTLEKRGRDIRGTDNEVVEEEETISSKRDLIISNYFSSVLYAEQIGYLCNNVKKRLPKIKFFIHSKSNRLQIVYSVFII